MLVADSRLDRCKPGHHLKQHRKRDCTEEKSCMADLKGGP